MARELDKFFPKLEELGDEVSRWADEHAEEFAKQLEEIGYENPEIPKADPRIVADRITYYEKDIQAVRNKMESKFAEKVRPNDSKQGRQRAADRMKTDIENRLNYERGRNKEIFFQTLDKLRQKAFGITHYKWETRGDGSVRPEHVTNDGEFFKWTEPSKVTGHPGDDWGCRCRAVPREPRAVGVDAINETDFGPLDILIGGGVRKIGKEGIERIEKIIKDKLKERAAREAAEKVVDRTIKISSKQAQKKYKHAEDFGLPNNYNKKNAKLFVEAIEKHVKDKGTDVIKGTYQKTIKVTHYYNEKTKINVMKGLDDNFISGYSLDEKQIDFLLRTGNIGGGTKNDKFYINR